MVAMLLWFSQIFEKLQEARGLINLLNPWTLADARGSVHRAPHIVRFGDPDAHRHLIRVEACWLTTGPLTA